MKAVISSTYDSKYLFFLPIVTWAWNKLGVDVICFMPQYAENEKERQKYFMVMKHCHENNLNIRTNEMFIAPKNKEATYAQCSRLYAACLDLPEDEILITSDADMVVFKLPHYSPDAVISITGADLVPNKQVPMCYLSATVYNWRERFEIEGRTYQQCLDDLLGHIEADHFRGNYWGKDQEEAHNKIYKDEYEKAVMKSYVLRTNGQNQFAAKRYDRDDAFLLERLNPDTIDFHMPRPGYTDQILK
jgi:hypothetical protein